MKTFLSLIFIASTLVFSIDEARGFDQKFTRFLSGHDLFRTFAQVFPGSKGRVPEECQQLTSTNRGSLGDSLPITGKPLNSTLPPSFFGWLIPCLSAHIDQDFTRPPGSYDAIYFYSPDAQFGYLRRYYGSSLINYFAKTDIEPTKDLRTVKWATVPTTEKKKMIHDRINYLIGVKALSPDHLNVFVTKIFGQLENESDELNIYSVAKRMTIFIVVSEEFLSY